MWFVTRLPFLATVVLAAIASVVDPDHEYEQRMTSFAQNLRRELAKTPTEVPPLVFIIGVQKGGSSSLMWMMITHPQLCEGARKETHFFGGNYENLVDGGTKFKDIKAEYYGLFTDKKCNGVANTSFVDGTPILHQAYWAAKNINAMYTETGFKDQLKFIAMLREPISRDFSWYQHHMRQVRVFNPTQRAGRTAGRGQRRARPVAVRGARSSLPLVLKPLPSPLPLPWL